MPGMEYDALLAAVGIAWPHSPLNLSLFLALAAALGVVVAVARHLSGYAARTRGFSAGAAVAGIRPGSRWWSRWACPALAGLLSINEVAGVHGRLLLDYVVGAGFAGIAVR